MDNFTNYFAKQLDYRTPGIPEHEKKGVTVMGQTTSSSCLLLQVVKSVLREKFKYGVQTYNVTSLNILLSANS